MTFMVVILLAFAISVTMAGFLLSFKPQGRGQTTIYTGVCPARRVVEPVPMRTRRITTPTARIERRTARAIAIPAFAGRITGRGRQAGEPAPWTIILIGLVSICILGLFTLNHLFPHAAVFSTVWFGANPQVTQTANPDPVYTATRNLVRLSQLDPSQYDSTQQYNLWAYSACSAAAMTEVINAYGHHYRIADILKVEASINEITPELGLLEDVGIQRTVARFGFKTTWGYNLSLDKVITIANQGRPVIVSFPPDRYAGGHLVVVIGGNSSTVLLADTSLWNRHSLSRAQFLNWWEGFYAIVTPN